MGCVQNFFNKCLLASNICPPQFGAIFVVAKMGKSRKFSVIFIVFNVSKATYKN